MAQQESTIDLMRKWQELNHELWNNWMNAARHLGKGPTGINDAYHEQVKAFESLVEDTLKLEHDWLEFMRRQAATNQATSPVGELFASTAERAIEARRHAWENFFQNAERVDLSGVGNAFGAVQGPQDMFSALRSMGDQLMSMGRKAAEASPGAQPTAGKSTAAKPGKSTQSSTPSEGEGPKAQTA